jgi:hypothetical protein
MIRVRRPYQAPKRQLAVPITAHTGELVVPLKQTKALNEFLFSSKQQLPKTLRNDLKRLITTVPIAL